MLVMAETAKKLQSQFTTDLVNPITHWYKSVLTGVLAQRLAKSHIRGSERFFVLGLLYHLGEMVTALRDPENILTTSMIRVRYRPGVNNCMRLVLTLGCSVAQYISNGSYQYSYMRH